MLDTMDAEVGLMFGNEFAGTYFPNRARSRTPGLSICRPLTSLHTLLLVVTPGFGRLYLITKSGDTTLLLEPQVGAKYFKLAWKRVVNQVE